MRFCILIIFCFVAVINSGCDKKTNHGINFDKNESSVSLYNSRALGLSDVGGDEFLNVMRKLSSKEAHYLLLAINHYANSPDSIEQLTLGDAIRIGQTLDDKMPSNFPEVGFDVSLYSIVSIAKKLGFDLEESMSYDQKTIFDGENRWISDSKDHPFMLIENLEITGDSNFTHQVKMGVTYVVPDSSDIPEILSVSRKHFLSICSPLGIVVSSWFTHSFDSTSVGYKNEVVLGNKKLLFYRREGKDYMQLNCVKEPER